VAGEPEVVTLGECLVALVAPEPGPLAEAREFRHFVAGAEANVAVGLARLGHRAAFIGRVGDDGFGQAIVRQLRGEGVDIRWLVTDQAAPTGLLVRTSGGLPPIDVLYQRRGSAGSRLAPEEVERAWQSGLATARWLHLTGITPALSETARRAVSRSIGLAREAGMTVSLDVNMRRRLWRDEQAAPVLRELAGQVDIVLGGVDELLLLAPGRSEPADVARRVLGLGPSTAVARLGASGALAVTASGEQVSRPALSVARVVDPVGAGDGFCAGWISARLRGAEHSTALETAVACAASVVAALGDMTGLPTRAELHQLVGGGGDVER
jgi:2-dehydro-3-deoxygluconokinase